MTRQLPAWGSRTLALALLAVALALVYVLALDPVLSRAALLDEEIEAERVALGRFTAVASQKSGAGEVERLGRLASASPAYIKGDTEALKTSTLQALLSELAAAQGVRVRSTRNLPVRERDDLRFIGVRMQFNAEIAQVRDLLHGIESTQPFLLVEGLQVQPVQVMSAGGQEQSGTLEVRFDVYAAVARKKG